MSPLTLYSTLQPVVRSMLDYAGRFLRLEREVDRLRNDLEAATGELLFFLGFPLPSLCFANPQSCMSAERSRAIDLSTDLRKQLDGARDAERESRRHADDLQRRLEKDKELMLGRVHGVADKLLGM